MVENPKKRGFGSVAENAQNISWFSSLLLLFQLFLLLFNLFQFNHQIVNAFDEFLQESSTFLTCINGLLILWCWLRGKVLNLQKQGMTKQDVTKEYKIINSCIYIANIVLLNQLYRNDKLKEINESIRSFLAGENVTTYVFAFFVIVMVVIFAFYIVRNTKSQNENGDEKPKDVEPNSKQSADVSKKKLPTSSPQDQSTKNVSVLFATIYLALILSIIAVIYVLVTKYDMVSNIIHDADGGSEIFIYFSVAVFAIALIILCFVIVTAVARSLTKLVYNIPKYVKQADISTDRMIKIVVGIVLIPVLYTISKLSGVGTDWVLNLLQEQEFLVVPFIMLFYFVLSMLFAEIVYGFFAEKSKNKWREKFSEMNRDIGKKLVEICEEVVKSFFRLVKFIPDFLEAIETVLLGEDSDLSDKPSKPENQNPQGD